MSNAIYDLQWVGDASRSCSAEETGPLWDHHSILKAFKRKNPLERALSLHVYRSSPSMTNGVWNIDFSL